jgi:hypothetical protein
MLVLTSQNFAQVKKPDKTQRDKNSGKPYGNLYCIKIYMYSPK